MRSITCVIFMLLSLFTLRAQKENLEINYFAHDHYNGAFLNVIDDIFNTKAYDSNSHTYLYMANASEPSVLLCDSNNYKGLEDFKTMLNGQLSHNVWAEVDIAKIIELVSKDDFIDNSAKPRYQYFTLNFYLTPSFFTYGYAETLISRLYWDLDLANHKNASVKVYLPSDVDVENFKASYGAMKLMDANEITLLTFDAN